VNIPIALLVQLVSIHIRRGIVNKNVKWKTVIKIIFLKKHFGHPENSANSVNDVIKRFVIAEAF
jgi:hypothetical protein